jgi:exodeoxyribonuclease VII small subunit
MNESQNKTELSFEQALLALEDIVERISKENLDLDEMIRLYEEGIGYLQVCQKNMETAEAKIRILNERIKQSGISEVDNG